MRILVVGGTGTIGKAVVAELKPRHEVLVAGRTSGDLRLDITDRASIKAAFEQAGRLDAVVSAAGRVKFAPFAEMEEADYAIGLKDKLLGQVNLVLVGRKHVADGGSFTLTSGVLSQEPMKGSASISMVNAGLEGFVRAAALELPRGIRVNVVSPPWVTETLIALKMNPSLGMPAATVAQAYLASVEGAATGQIIDPRKLS
ncbi:MAG: short chain dehydrogenase, partial [Elusimicrobia bacterium]|nr:short chain dehydrogenase [Elusimicrobiota bacterium]